MAEYQGESVVLKKMSLVGMTATKRQRMLNHFKSELAIMTQLRSPRVARFYGVVTTDTTFLGLVMEYCAGGSLRACLDGESGKVTADLQRVWGLDVALGMAHLYSQGVEHRDLKALNVLLTRDLRCKVTDFRRRPAARGSACPTTAESETSNVAIVAARLSIWTRPSYHG